MKEDYAARLLAIHQRGNNICQRVFNLLLIQVTKAKWIRKGMAVMDYGMIAIKRVTAFAGL
ncbi:hypothetical protein [Paenibacillus lacisoli]|uniref:hypothetical protein n=1 Tax=Paenibacillus lacisoli TaxID=3064525 RepID=UPI002729CE76|nr:hypothetical protein [Paenibacillus sp. JX-17]